MPSPYTRAANALAVQADKALLEKSDYKEPPPWKESAKRDPYVRSLAAQGVPWAKKLVKGTHGTKVGHGAKKVKRRSRGRVKRSKR